MSELAKNVFCDWSSNVYIFFSVFLINRNLKIITPCTPKYVCNSSSVCCQHI